MHQMAMGENVNHLNRMYLQIYIEYYLYIEILSETHCTVFSDVPLRAMDIKLLLQQPFKTILFPKFL